MLQVLKMQEKLRILSRRVHSNSQKTEIDTKEINVKCKGDAIYQHLDFYENVSFAFLIRYHTQKCHFIT